MSNTTHRINPNPLNHDIPKVEISFGEESFSQEEKKLRHIQTKAPSQTVATPTVLPVSPSAPIRKLAQEREAVVKHFTAGTAQGYFVLSLFDDGLPGEILIHFFSGEVAMQEWCKLVASVVSLSLQHGVPLESYSNLFIMEDATVTLAPIQNREVLTLLFEWLRDRFILPKPADSP